MTAKTSDFVFFGLVILGLFVYMVFMITIYKYRKKAPFNSPFFKLIFVLGVIDISRQIEDWLLFKFPMFAWCAMNKVVISLPHFIAKVHIMFTWYFGHAQVVGVVLLALNRVAACAFLKDWTPGQLRMNLVALWGLPLLWNIPLWPQSFYYSDNGTDGGAFLYWANRKWQWYYLVSCGMLCSSMAAVCAVCYLMILWKKRQQKKQMKKTKKQKDRDDNQEIKLVFIGVVLAVLLGFCGFACTFFAYATDPAKMAAAVPFLNLVNDMLCYINPYLLLACSKQVRAHFKSVLFCKPINAVHVHVRHVKPSSTRRNQDSRRE